MPQLFRCKDSFVSWFNKPFQMAIKPGGKMNDEGVNMTIEQEALGTSF
jgi:hypothetical protein